MALKQFNPVTPSLRGTVLIDRKELYKGKPVKGLTEGKSSSGGRNNHGRTTSRFRGGGHKRSYRIVDFKRRFARRPRHRRSDCRLASRLRLTILHEHAGLSRRLQLGEAPLTLCRLGLLELLVARICARCELLLPLEDRLAEVAGKRRTEPRHVTIGGRRAIEGIAVRPRGGL